MAPRRRVPAVQGEVGQMLREWRERRRRSQLDLALDAGVSTRHLSFVEKGRSKPGRDMLLSVLRELEVPFREQNRVLLTAGHAPAFPERPLDDPSLSPLREALDLALKGHEPYPAVAFDRGWNLVAANSPMWALAALVEIDPSLLEPPVNILRVGFHPRGLAPHLANLSEWRAHFLTRLRRQAATTADPSLARLLEEIEAYPGGESPHSSGDVLGPLRVRVPDGREASFLGMFAIFDTPFEVTASELAIELLFPADRETAEALEAVAASRVRERAEPPRPEDDPLAQHGARR
jgi:transcriptional regulator with XRE-family HTH domain